MKKFFKVIGIIFAVIIGVVVLFVGFLLIKGPSDPIVLTPEELKASNEEQIALYSNIDLTGFSTTSLTGESVSSDYFKDYDLTMINLWTTTCSPCIDEMPGIAKLYDTRPEGSNIISICVDTVNDKQEINKKSFEFAAKVMKDSGADFITLIPDKSLQESLTNRTNIFPTTIFVDRDGKVVGEPHLGSTTEEAYRKAILDRMALVSDQTGSDN